MTQLQEHAISTIRVSAFRWVPPFAQGLVRDLRVRWALEEAGIPYEERLIGFEDQKSHGYRCLQPFGQVPAYEEGDLVLFESGAIVMHLAERSEVLNLRRTGCDARRAPHSRKRLPTRWRRSLKMRR